MKSRNSNESYSAYTATVIGVIVTFGISLGMTNAVTFLNTSNTIVLHFASKFFLENIRTDVKKKKTITNLTFDTFRYYSRLGPHVHKSCPLLSSYPFSTLYCTVVRTNPVFWPGRIHETSLKPTVCSFYFSNKCRALVALRTIFWFTSTSNFDISLPSGMRVPKHVVWDYPTEYSGVRKKEIPW